MAGKILLVEDNEKSRKLARILLLAAGYEVLEAPEAKIGLDILEKEKVELIILDVRLPDINGIDMAKMLRENKDHTPIVFVTASVMPEDIEKMKAVSYCEHISKPINTRTFVKDIERCIK